MREILFRGKRVDNGEWVEGAFLNDRNGAFYICPAVSDITYGDNGNRRRIGCWYKVDPSTVGQYTGLTDKNGKRIFEGDVIQLDYTGRNLGVAGRAEVVFESGKFGMKWGWHKEIVCLDGFANTTLEVIGAIHDNPELLKEDPT